MSVEQEKDSLSLKRNRGGDGGLDGLGGPGPDKKKRKSSTQAPSFAPLSEYAPPAIPSSDHLVASNPFDDNYNCPPLSVKVLNTTNPYFGPSTHFPALGGYGPPRMVPHIQNRMPSPYGGPYQIRSQPPHPFAQNPMGPMGMGFNRPPGFSYGHPDSPAFANQPIFNNTGGIHLPTGQPFRPGLGENLSQLPIPNVNQIQSSPDGLSPGFGLEGPGNLPLAVKPSPDMSPGFSQPSSQLPNFGQPNTPPTSTSKQDPNESANKKNAGPNAGPNATSPRKQNQLPVEAAVSQDTPTEPKGKNRGIIPASLDGGAGMVEKINGVIRLSPDPVKKSPQSTAHIETPAERNRRPGNATRSGGSLSNKKPSARPNRPNNSTSSSSEPVYPCGICLGEVNDDQEAILCEASCQKWFHRVCTGMTETAYNLLTAEAAAVWGCDSCMEEKEGQLLKTKEVPDLPMANSKGQS